MQTENIKKGWKKVKLSEITEIINGGTPSTLNEQYWNGNIFWVTPKDMSDNKKFKYISNGERNITDIGLKNSSAKLLPTGTVLLSSRAPIGYVAITKTELSTNQGFKSFICSNEINNDFLYYYLKHNKYYLESIAGGSTFKELRTETVKGIEITIPESIQTQQKIASILSKYDDLIENNTKRIKILEQTAQEIYKEWFVNFRFPGYENVKLVDSGSEFGEIPEGWEVKRVGEKFNTILGGTPSRKNPNYWGGNIPWVNSGKVNELRIINESEFITEEGYKKSSTKLMPIRTTLLAITGATLGQVSLTEIEICANQSVIGIYDINKKFDNYVYCYIKNNIQEIIKSAGGGAQQHINKDIVNETKILIPNIEIIEKFNFNIDDIFGEVFNILKQNQNLKQTRDMLIPKLVSGEVEVDSLDVKI